MIYCALGHSSPDSQMSDAFDLTKITKFSTDPCCGFGSGLIIQAGHAFD